MESRKKVLIITYYWPPAGGISVQRWVKFVKYSRESGFEPIVYTVSNGEYPILDAARDHGLPKDITVIKRPIWEPYHFYKIFSGKKSKAGGRDEIKSADTATFTQKISIWLRGNFFIPDARCFWIKPSVKFITEYLKANPVDAVVSTGPPHTTHLIALGLKEKLKLKWLADFRDPWTTMDYYKDLTLTKWADRKHHMLELEVLTRADVVTVVGRAMEKEFDAKGANVKVVTNGFDEDDFVSNEVPLDKDFSIVHTGSLYESRNPHALWNALGELKKENHPLIQSLKVKLIGNTDRSVIDSAKSAGLESKLEVFASVPHAEAIRNMKSAQLLMLQIDRSQSAQWVVTGKLFEYLAAKRPILCIGPTDGDAASILNQTKAGSTFGFDDVKGIKKHLINLYEQFKIEKLVYEGRYGEDYSYRQLTKKMAAHLNSIIA
jgi:glycosyltransferase involved in cell wall biosynthesis